MRIVDLPAHRGVSVVGRNGAATHCREFVNALVARGTEVKVVGARPADRGGRDQLACEVIAADSDPLLHRLRRLTASSEAENGHASEVHGLLLNQSITETL